MMAPTISIPSWKDRQSSSQFSKVQLPVVPWRSFKLLMPHRMRRRLRSKLRSRVSPATSIASLQTSFSVKDTVRSLQSYRWSLYDLQYILLAIIGIFSLSLIQSPGVIGKTTIASLLLLSLLLPITRQFFLPFLPIAAWLIFFYACQYVPARYYPKIN
jgi:inositol phosphorylceramide synthase catalytic subunit